MVPLDCATGIGSFTEVVLSAVDCANGAGFELAEKFDRTAPV